MQEKHHPIKTCKRFNTPFHAHELTFSCLNRRPFLSQTKPCLFLIESIIMAKSKHHFALWAYVFMPEHIHLLIWPNEEAYSISAIMHSIKQSTSRKAFIYLRKNNPAGLKHFVTGQKNTPYRFWMDGSGYDRNIFSNEAIKSSIDYIHNNPVKRGLVSAPGDWQWSSYKDWAGIGTGLMPIDMINIPLL
ncbi:MAG: transposase [candidate division Zixibacteria bacterium]|nr:transposase [candidate division Zixibacteria bacterium]